MPRGASPKREKVLQEIEQQLTQHGPQQGPKQGRSPSGEHDDQADAALTVPAAVPSERQVGRRGTGHMRRNTVRRARSS